MIVNIWVKSSHQNILPPAQRSICSRLNPACKGGDIFEILGVHSAHGGMVRCASVSIKVVPLLRLTADNSFNQSKDSI